MEKKTNANNNNYFLQLLFILEFDASLSHQRFPLLFFLCSGGKKKRVNHYSTHVKLTYRN